ncbi:MAG: hypothetical protein AAF497_29860, partial [Planctomycetota bacterium]
VAMLPRRKTIVLWGECPASRKTMLSQATGDARSKNRMLWTIGGRLSLLRFFSQLPLRNVLSLR